MITFSKTSEKCQKCKYFDGCDKKRMVMCAMAEMPPPVLSVAGESAGLLAADEASVKHYYRTIKAGGGMNFDIDLEEVKRQLERNLHKALYCPFQYGA